MKHLAYKQMNILYVVAIVAIGAMSWQSHALKRFATAEPAVLVSVDFERVFLSLEERAFELANNQAILDKMDEDLAARRRHIDSYEIEFELYQPGSPKYKELEQDRQLELIEWEAQSEYRALRASSGMSKSLRTVYKHIRAATAELAKQNGWDYVFVNETVVELPVGDNIDMGAVISARRMLYANSEMDVSDQLIEFMNAAFDEMAVR
jgi:Skp family chaperone for outer membrane proteins